MVVIILLVAVVYFMRRKKTKVKVVDKNVAVIQAMSAKKTSGVQMAGTSHVPRFDPNTGQPMVQPEPPVPRFDPNTGQPIVQPRANTTDKVSQLKQLKECLDGGILTQEEFDAQKKLILNPPGA